MWDNRATATVAPFFVIPSAVGVEESQPSGAIVPPPQALPPCHSERQTWGAAVPVTWLPRTVGIPRRLRRSE